MSGVASLGMYDMPTLNAANDALWAGIAARLRAAGLDELPPELDRKKPHAAIWRDPELLLAQTCGYPLMTALKDSVRVVAAPIYDWPGCREATHCSYLVVHADSSFLELSQLRSCRAAINGPDSNSGMNLFRHAIAPLAEGEPFFASVTETGSHLHSMEHVAEGRADIAAVDCVTFAHAGRDRPDLVARLRILAETAPSPTLPFVTRASLPGEQVEFLRQALRGTIRDAALRDATRALGLVGVETACRSDYEILLRYERDAVELGYPALI